MGFFDLFKKKSKKKSSGSSSSYVSRPIPSFADTQKANALKYLKEEIEKFCTSKNATMDERSAMMHVTGFGPSPLNIQPTVTIKRRLGPVEVSDGNIKLTITLIFDCKTPITGSNLTKLQNNIYSEVANIKSSFSNVYQRDISSAIDKTGRIYTNRLASSWSITYSYVGSFQGTLASLGLRIVQ